MMHYHCPNCELAAQQGVGIDIHKQDYLHCDGVDIESPEFDIESWSTMFEPYCTCNACFLFLSYLLSMFGVDTVSHEDCIF